jgi:hypothetical protein
MAYYRTVICTKEKMKIVGVIPNFVDQGKTDSYVVLLEDKNGNVHSKFLEDSKEYDGKHPSFYKEKNGLFEDIPNLL